MTKVIGVSGLQNNGKSTLLRHLDMLSSVKVYKEVARDLFPVLENFGMDKFQEYIETFEYCRLGQIMKDKQEGLYSIIVTDRTVMDNVFFSKLHGTQPALGQDASIYDRVVLLNKPIGDSNRFPEYNGIEESFNEFIRESFGNRVDEFTNFKEQEKEIFEYFERFIFNK